MTGSTGRVYGSRTWVTDPASGATLVRIDAERAAITGTTVQVGQMLDRLARSGRLASASDPQPTGQGGQVLVTVRVLPPRPAAAAVTASPGVRRRVRPWVWWTAGGAAVAVLAVVAWLVAVAVAWLVAHWAVVVAALVGVAVLLGLLGRVGVCVGVHCPGCRHR